MRSSSTGPFRSYAPSPASLHARADPSPHPDVTLDVPAVVAEFHTDRFPADERTWVAWWEDGRWQTRGADPYRPMGCGLTRLSSSRTQMHADALPDADPDTLRDPAEVAEHIIACWPVACRRVGPAGGGMIPARGPRPATELRLMHIDPAGTVVSGDWSDLPRVLRPGDVVVFNDGMHQAFAPCDVLLRAHAQVARAGYRNHEFGDSVLVLAA